MKRFITLFSLALIMSLGVALSANAGIEKQVVNTEFAHHDFISVMVYDSLYIAEATQEVVSEFTPDVIGEISGGFKSSVYHPPALNGHNISINRRW
jgi:hypothetical protein